MEGIGHQFLMLSLLLYGCYHIFQDSRHEITEEYVIGSQVFFEEIFTEEVDMGLQNNIFYAGVQIG
jgi:hypothetical protein